VNSLSAFTNLGFTDLQRQINDNASRAYAGVASVSALAGLHHIDKPGHVSIAGGMGGYRDAVALAAGASYLSENGSFRLSTGVSFSPSRPGASWNLGGAFVW
jgi:autotransporter adhesin